MGQSRTKWLLYTIIWCWFKYMVCFNVMGTERTCLCIFPTFPKLKKEKDTTTAQNTNG